MSNKSKWFLPINFCNQTGNWSFRSCTHFRISVAQSLYQHHQSPWSCDFPCVASIYLCNSTTYCYTCSWWVSRSLSVTTIVSYGLPQPFSWLNLVSLTRSKNSNANCYTGTAKLTKKMDLTLLKNWIPD